MPKDKRAKWQNKIAKYQQKLNESDQQGSSSYDHHSGDQISNWFTSERPGFQTSLVNHKPNNFQLWPELFSNTYSRINDMMSDSFFSEFNDASNVNMNNSNFHYESYSYFNGDQTYDVLSTHNGNITRQESWKKDKNGIITENNKKKLINGNPPNVKEIR